jgi:hypothetical protein
MLDKRRQYSVHVEQGGELCLVANVIVAEYRVQI